MLLPLKLRNKPTLSSFLTNYKHDYGTLTRHNDIILRTMRRNICDDKRIDKKTLACVQIETRVYTGNTNVHIKMAALSLTEEMFAAIQGLSYSESIKYITPGSGLHEDMFNSLEHAKYYELDTRLTYKGYQRNKGARRKTIVNPTMMYTLFSVFAEYSPQQIWRNMVQWINEHKLEYERQTMLTFTAKETQLDTWLSIIDSNSMPGDEFALFALCRM